MGVAIPRWSLYNVMMISFVDLVLGQVIYTTRQNDGTVLEIMFANGDVTEPADLVGKVTVTGELIPNTVITYGTNFT